MNEAKYNLQAADNAARKDKKGLRLNFRVYTLAEALEEARGPLTPRQRELRDRYGDRWAAGNTGGVGCIWKEKKEEEE